MIKAGIVGGAGYTGGELIRLLINHPDVELVFANSSSNAGKFLHEVHKDLLGDTDLKFSSESVLNEENVDVIFLCAGHGEAKKFIEANEIHSSIKLIDIGNDFRLSKDTDIKGRHFVYGLVELNKTHIQSAQNIANPGCFATAIQLGLLPLAKAGLLKDVYTTAITGSTGAGQSLSSTSHFSWRANNVSAYKTLSHQHLGEIHQSLNQLQNSFPDSPSGVGGVNFVPWRGDFTRGIFASSITDTDLSLDELKALYKNFYTDAVFTHYSDTTIDLKQVVNTNKCLINIEKQGNKMVVHSAIDNLLKGASGQALQNMNLMFGLDETIGLKLKANYF
ncbi:MAG: N-acetyl-gamma-glutamyl-phosphate reductase [Chitinophaga sp.]|jgi:N-acetyl-gamma-glutamyl-phosphate reductase|nr:N-acetyl-gamma-glutamyl-phosphate reductase [Chitinophaga sp.]